MFQQLLLKSQSTGGVPTQNISKETVSYCTWHKQSRIVNLFQEKMAFLRRLLCGISSSHPVCKCPLVNDSGYIYKLGRCLRILARFTCTSNASDGVQVILLVFVPVNGRWRWFLSVRPFWLVFLQRACFSACTAGTRIRARYRSFLFHSSHTGLHSLCQIFHGRR